MGRSTSRSRRLRSVASELADAVDELRFSSPVAHVYNPLRYARAPYDRYLERFADLGAKTLFLGMNPGPWGMAQTGVPFGAVSLVRDWMEIEAPVEKPAVEHPKRPVDGFACRREEVSGARLWGWARDTFGAPESFFERFFVANYCPLIFLADTGRNLTPDKLRADERRVLLEPCNEALLRTVEILGVDRAIGVGAWAEGRLRSVLGDGGPDIGRILHPSPASPAANRGWAEAATRQLQELGFEIG